MYESIVQSVPAMVSSTPVETNISQGSYRPAFFDLTDFNVSRADFNSCYFANDDVERQLLHGQFSFAYLREDKLRTIDIYSKEGSKHLPFKEFLNHFGITIRSKNLFKTGKYLSRVFRPVRFGGFYQDLNIYINSNPKHSGKVTDGISLISVSLAKSLGWDDAKENMSAQFTLFFKDGLVKGHCILSEKIEHDVVIYGDENIKEEISLCNGYEYVTLEPVKLGESLRMDIQSMLNLWNLFGPEQYLSWAHKGMQQYKEDLFEGRLSKWLDNFDDINIDDYEKEKWTLRKAMWHKVDYTRYPGLIRLGWSMFKNSILRYADDKDGKPVFRFPVPNGKRGYIRVDLRDHDLDGNFKSTVDEGIVELDSYGNIWIHENDIEEFMEVKGGADQDDSCAIIPVEGGKAVMYRNPNQYGEYGIHKIKTDGFELKHEIKLVDGVPIKDIKQKNESTREVFSSGNLLLDRFLLSMHGEEEKILAYSLGNLIRTFIRITQNSVSIGVAANAEMIRSAIGITDPWLFLELTEQFNWNLENIIDATVKDGTDARKDMEAVSGLFNYIVENKIPVAASILSRFPERMKKDVEFDAYHPLDELFDAVKSLIDKADKEIMGEGSASKGNRIPGRIDFLDTPIMRLGKVALESPVYNIALGIYKEYNRSLAILLDSTKDQLLKEMLRKEGIEEIQTKLLNRMKEYSKEERSLIVNVWAYEIYKSVSAVHDSILWIGDKKELRGTASDTIEMLANLKLAHHVDLENGTNRFKTYRKSATSMKEIRVWCKEELQVECFSEIKEITVEGKDVTLGKVHLNLGDECSLVDGNYQVRTITPAYSRKEKGKILKNSIIVCLY